MAEWGKGDPRWIVEERPDGTRNEILVIFYNLFFFLSDKPK